MASPGWYADPAGQPGMYRYWDGRTWSAAVTTNPAAPPPPGSGPLAHPGPPAFRPGPGTSAVSPLGQRRPSWGWLAALVAVLAVVAVVVVLVVQRVGPTSVANPPVGQPSTQVCPKPDNGTPSPQPGDGRVHAGRLSYPQLGSPWSPPQPQDNVAFGKGVVIQSVEVERNTTQSWLAAVLLGELVAGDGFFTPKDGASIVVKCVSGTFYGGSAVTRADRRNEALTVDGHDAWVIESQLGFSVPGIQAKSELLIVVVVDTGTGSAGLFYASIPENAQQLIQPARDALAALKVDG